MPEPTTDNLQFLDHKAGDEVMREGSLASGLYILMSGTLEVTVKGVKVAEISSKGSYVGEIASILRCRRIATVKALTDARFMVVKNINKYFDETPSAAFGIAQALASRIMEMNRRIVDYQAELTKLVRQGEDAAENHDLAKFIVMLTEMQSLLVEGKMGE